jgi:hypothetical protein
MQCRLFRRTSTYGAMALLAVTLNLESAQISTASTAPQQIIRQAIAATGAASSFHIVGSIRQDHVRVEMNVAMSQGAAVGWIAEGGNRVNFKRLGKDIYALAGSTSSDQWVAVPVSSTDHRVLSLLSTPKSFVAKFFPVLTTYHYSDVRRLDQHGRPIFSMVGTNGNEHDTFEVAAGRPHFFLAISQSEHSLPNVISFSDYDAAIRVSRPLPDDGTRT